MCANGCFPHRPRPAPARWAPESGTSLRAQACPSAAGPWRCPWPARRGRCRWPPLQQTAVGAPGTVQEPQTHAGSPAGGCCNSHQQPAVATQPGSCHSAAARPRRWACVRLPAAPKAAHEPVPACSVQNFTLFQTGGGVCQELYRTDVTRGLPGRRLRQRNLLTWAPGRCRQATAEPAAGCCASWPEALRRAWPCAVRCQPPAAHHWPCACGRPALPVTAERPRLARARQPCRPPCRQSARLRAGAERQPGLRPRAVGERTLTMRRGALSAWTGQKGRKCPQEGGAAPSPAFSCTDVTWALCCWPSLHHLAI